MAEIGYTALLLALLASIYSSITYAIAARGRHPALSETARNSLFASCGLIFISVVVLLIALITHNFQIEYVASYTSRDTSLIYRFSALWAGNNGSLLFWAWVLSLFILVAIINRRDRLVPYAASIMMLTQAFFVLLLLAVSNPFQKLPFIPPDGTGLNPLLENPGMIVHPPLLLAGYAVLTIPFAFAMSALLTKRLGYEWTITVRKWMLVAWLLLGAGNIIGAWWAYVELGWGGYWAWDPVENAGLMPWLIVTAFLHSAMMQRKRGIFKTWTMVLVILAFILALFGTFITRSGILSSVHTFGETGLEPYFITFISLSLFGSLILLYSRQKELKSEAEVESLVSRESTFLLNNLLFVGATAIIFLGTIFPALSEALMGSKVEVNATFYNRVNVPIFVTTILLAGICAVIGWRQASLRNLYRNLYVPLGIAVFVAVILLIFGIRQWYAVITFSLFGFVLSSLLYQWFRGVRGRHRSQSENYIKAFINLISENRPRYGGYLIHIAVVLMAIGVTASSLFSTEKEVTLKRGESMNIEGYTLTYNNLNHRQTPSKLIVTAYLSVYDQGKLIAKLTPEKYFHQSYEQPVTEVAIRSTPIEDLYVILANASEKDASFKVLVNPLVVWIWIGGAILTTGGLIAYLPERRRRAKVETMLRELEEDFQAGNLTKDDYSQLKAKYQKQATSAAKDIEKEIEKQVKDLRRRKRK